MPNNLVVQRTPAVPEWHSIAPTATAGQTVGRDSSLDVDKNQIANELKKENYVEGHSDTVEIYAVERTKSGTQLMY